MGSVLSYDGRLNKQEIDQEIKKILDRTGIELNEVFRSQKGKDQKELKRLWTLRYFEIHRPDYVFYSRNIVKLRGRRVDYLDILYHLVSGKWRVKLDSKWCSSLGPKTFCEYIESGNRQEEFKKLKKAGK